MEIEREARGTRRRRREGRQQNREAIEKKSVRNTGKIARTAETVTSKTDNKKLWRAGHRQKTRRRKKKDKEKKKTEEITTKGRSRQRK